MKAEKMRRNFWTIQEIDCMLNLLGNVYRIQGNTQTTTYTFIQIASKMKKKGLPNKSAAQIRRKWFQMKSAYLCYKRGNTERLLLIPERFRSIIAQFVDREVKLPQYNHHELEHEESSTSPPPPQSAVAAPSPPVPPSPPLVPLSPPAALTQHAPPLVPMQMPPGAANINHQNHINNVQFNNNGRSNTATASSARPSLDREPQITRMNNTFDDFLASVKHSHRLINNDFMIMQKALVDYDHARQKERDAKLVSFIRNLSYDF